MDSRQGRLVLLGLLLIFLGSPEICGADFAIPAKPNLMEALACKLAGLPSNCNQPNPVPSGPVPSGPGPAASPPASPPLSPVSPPGPAVPPLSPGPATPESPPAIAPQPSSASPPTPSPAPAQLSPAPVPSEAVPAPAPFEAVPAPAPSDATPAPAPMPDAPAPAPQSPDGPTLVIAAGGLAYATRVSSSIYTISTGEWEAGPDFSAASGRYGFPMIQLSSTEVLAAGGDRGGVATAEIYSTITQDWTLTEDMRQYRSGNSMVLLPDGSAFTAGGLSRTGDQILLSTEQYSQGVWTAGPNMDTARSSFTMLTYEANGVLNVLVCGGLSNIQPVTGTCEEWSPAGGPNTGFSYLNSQLSAPVYLHRAVLLGGSPFVTGGTNAQGSVQNTAQLLVNGAWETKNSMQTARSAHEMVVLQNGAVLVCGGLDNDDNSLSSCEIFNGETWNPAPSLPNGQSFFKMLVLPNGDVLYYGSINPGEPCSWKLTPGASAWVPIQSSASLDSRYRFGMAEV